MLTSQIIFVEKRRSRGEILGKKIEPKKYICGEKMMNMRSDQLIHKLITLDSRLDSKHISSDPTRIFDLDKFQVVRKAVEILPSMVKMVKIAAAAKLQ